MFPLLETLHQNVNSRAKKHPKKGTDETAMQKLDKVS